MLTSCLGKVPSDTQQVAFHTAIQRPRIIYSVALLSPIPQSLSPMSGREGELVESVARRAPQSHPDKDRSGGFKVPSQQPHSTPRREENWDAQPAILPLPPPEKAQPENKTQYLMGWLTNQ